MCYFASCLVGDDYIDPNAVPSWHGLPYVTAMLKGRTCQFTLKGGSSQSFGDDGGTTLTTLYDGVRPQHYNYEPMCERTTHQLADRIPRLLFLGMIEVLNHRACGFAGARRAQLFLARAVRRWWHLWLTSHSFSRLIA